MINAKIKYPIIENILFIQMPPSNSYFLLVLYSDTLQKSSYSARQYRFLPHFGRLQELFHMYVYRLMAIQFCAYAQNWRRGHDPALQS